MHKQCTSLLGAQAWVPHALGPQPLQHGEGVEGLGELVECVEGQPYNNKGDGHALGVAPLTQQACTQSFRYMTPAVIAQSSRYRLVINLIYCDAN